MLSHSRLFSGDPGTITFDAPTRVVRRSPPITLEPPWQGTQLVMRMGAICPSKSTPAARAPEIAAHRNEKAANQREQTRITFLK